MGFFDVMVSNWTLAALLMAAAIAFLWNGCNRVNWNREWDPKVTGTDIPEANWTYDADDLMKFVNAARGVTINGRPALGYYADVILRRCDIAYSIALASITAYLWFRIALAVAPSRELSWSCATTYWLAPFFGAMAIAYGVADIAEDCKLAAILWPKQGRAEFERYPSHVDRADAAAANMLTRIKMMSLSLSLIGVLLFYAIRFLQFIAGYLIGRRGSGKERLPTA